MSPDSPPSPPPEPNSSKSTFAPRRCAPRLVCLAVGIALVWWAGRGLDRWLRPQLGGTGLQIGGDAPGGGRTSDSLTARLDRPSTQGEHPLGPAIDVAKSALDYFRENVQDYTAVFIKQERVGDTLAEEQQAFLKIRQSGRRGDPPIPFSVYMRFQVPESVAGREVIYVAGRNDGRLTAHEGGLLGLATVHLAPTSMLAMRGNRFPITEIGIETMIRRMIEKGERDTRMKDCVVTVNRQLTVNGHPATQIEIKHPQQHPHLDFHIARILLDDALNVPVAYESYDWPEAAGTEPELIERYQYAELQLNVGLTEADFDPANPEYHFPWTGR